MTQHRHPVEPLPRNTIAAAQLKNERDRQLQLQLEQLKHQQQQQSGDTAGSAGTAATAAAAVLAARAEESLLALKGHIPDKVLHQLAPFQRDAVQFVMSNRGRALVADEMGLGE